MTIKSPLVMDIAFVFAFDKYEYIVCYTSVADNATAESTADFSVNMDISLAKPPSFASSTKVRLFCIGPFTHTSDFKDFFFFF